MYRYNLPEKYQILDGSVLKIIACITMFIDHAAVCLIYNSILIPNAPLQYGTTLYTLYNVYKVMRGIGRTAFPIYCFLLVEGFIHTKSRPKYALRLLIFGIVSEIPFDLCIYGQLSYTAYNNVYFTLLIGLLAIWVWDCFKDRWYIQLPVCAALFYAARFFHTDYGWKGVLLIFVLYLMHMWRVPQVFFGLVSMYWELPYVVLGFIPMLFYSGRRGRQLKYFYYLFYPGHLMLLYLISVYFINGV